MPPHPQLVQGARNLTHSLQNLRRVSVSPLVLGTRCCKQSGLPQLLLAHTFFTYDQPRWSTPWLLRHRCVRQRRSDASGWRSTQVCQPLTSSSRLASALETIMLGRTPVVGLMVGRFCAVHADGATCGLENGKPNWSRWAGAMWSCEEPAPPVVAPVVATPGTGACCVGGAGAR